MKTWILASQLYKELTDLGKKISILNSFVDSCLIFSLDRCLEFAQ